MKLLIVVDMQNDFIDGSLGTPEAVAIVPYVKEVIENFDGEVIYTRDTHSENYMETQEGKKLPVLHCVKGTPGWEISKELPVKEDAVILDKVTFGSSELGDFLKKLDSAEKIEEVELIGLCTDICVISNAMIVKAYLPEAEITVDAKACAGVSVETHKNALNAMKVCQMTVINE